MAFAEWLDRRMAEIEADVKARIPEAAQVAADAIRAEVAAGGKPGGLGEKVAESITTEAYSGNGLVIVTATDARAAYLPDLDQRVARGVAKSRDKVRAVLFDGLGEAGNGTQG